MPEQPLDPNAPDANAAPDGQPADAEGAVIAGPTPSSPPPLSDGAETLSPAEPPTAETLTQEEIETLQAAAGGAIDPSVAAPQALSASPADPAIVGPGVTADAVAGSGTDDALGAAAMFSQADIDAALAGSAGPMTAPGTIAPVATVDQRLDSGGRPFDAAADAMAAAIAEERAARGSSSSSESPAVDVKAFDLPDFGAAKIADATQDISILRDVDLKVHIELGRTMMFIEDVLKLSEGSVVELDNLAGDPVDVYVNDRLVAHGEVLVLNDNFCVRVNEIVTGPQRVSVA